MEYSNVFNRFTNVCSPAHSLRSVIRRAASLVTAAAFGSAVLLQLPVQTSAEQPITMTIDKVQYIEPESLPVDENGNPLPRTATVSVRINGNTDGYRAAEFGITYDSRLVLQSAEAAPLSGAVFSYAVNPQNELIWIGLASSDAELTATTARSALVNLTFVIPDTFQIGDVYSLSFSWTGVDGSPSYWYTEPGVDRVEEIYANSIGGSISIPDPSAPYLSSRELQMNRGTSADLTVEGYDGAVTWFSDHPNIADVENGTVKAIDSGFATIYALAGSLLLSCDVQVTEAFYYSIRDEGAITITDPDDQVFLLYPDSESLVTWISTNPTVVSVDKNGKLTSQMNGSAQILATSNGVTMARAVIVDFTADSTENSSSVQASGTMEEPKRQVGDVTGDGEIGLVDVIKINRNLLGLDSLTPQQITAADAYHDGTVNSTDSLTILRYCVSLVEELPVEP